ncbi:MAG: pyridoxal phosphate-dependent aminotransferase [Alphaproteobacteria bacterium]|nr:pyridoxal phosphate-dependent aminotransferase [Alphaproteobacteria bacterium]
MSILSDRVAKIKLSPTFAFNSKAAALKRNGKDIISLTVGEPDFDTPQNIKTAAIDAINNGKTKYTDVDGIPALKEAVIAKFKRENNLDFRADQITIGAGGKQVIYNLLMATLNKGDEVVIPSPYWASYPDIVSLAEGKPVVVNCKIENGLKLTPEELSNNISSQTKWLILNSPNNPTGAVYSKAELAALSEVLKQHPNVHILSDDIYEHQVFEDFKFFNIINACPQLKERVFIVNGVSKCYSMTGWRIGYGAGDSKLISAISTIQSQSTSNPCSISQYAALEALNGTQDFVPFAAKELEAKRDMALEILNSIQGLEAPKPLGAFYIFPCVKSLFNSSTPSGIIVNNSYDFAIYLLEEMGVAVVPGSAFGAEGYIRISTSMNRNMLRQGCLRIKEGCSKLKRNILKC